MEFTAKELIVIYEALGNLADAYYVDPQDIKDSFDKILENNDEAKFMMDELSTHGMSVDNVKKEFDNIAFMMRTIRAKIKACLDNSFDRLDNIENASDLSKAFDFSFDGGSIEPRSREDIKEHLSPLIKEASTEDLRTMVDGLQRLCDVILEEIGNRDK